MSHTQVGIPAPNTEFPEEIKNVAGSNKFGIDNTTTISNEITTIVNSDKSLTLSGTASSSWFAIVSERNFSVSKGTYTLSRRTFMSLRLIVRLYYDENTYAQFSIDPYTLSKTVTLAQNAIKIYAWMEGATSGTQYSGTEYLQLEEGSEMSEYCPYNSIGFKVQNKNLFNKAGDFNYGTGRANSITLQSDGTLKTIANFSGSRAKGQLIQVKPNTNYMLSGILVSADGNATNNAIIEVMKSSIYNSRVAYLNILSSVTKPYSWQLSFNSGSETAIWISLSGWTSPVTQTTETVFDKIQLEEGNSVTDCIDFAEQTKYFTFEDGQYLAEGDYLADDGIHKVREKVILDGATDGKKVTGVELYSPNGLYYCLCGSSVNGNGGANGLLSSHFKPKYSVGLGQIYIAYSGTALIFILPDQTITTAQQANAWLAQQYANGTPVTAEYPLLQEVVIPYTQNQQTQWNAIKTMKTYKNISHLNGEANIPPTLDIVYKKDLETLFANLDARLTLVE